MPDTLFLFSGCWYLFPSVRRFQLWPAERHTKIIPLTPPTMPTLDPCRHPANCQPFPPASAV